MRFAAIFTAIFAAIIAALVTCTVPLTAAPPNASVNSMLAYPLTAEKLDRYAIASQAMTALISKDPAVLNKLKPTAANAPNSIDQTVTFTRQHCPECIGTVEKTGMNYRDYILFQGCLIISYVSAVRPRASSQVHVRPENIRFVLANRPKIERILAEQRQHPKP